MSSLSINEIRPRSMFLLNFLSSREPISGPHPRRVGLLATFLSTRLPIPPPSSFLCLSPPPSFSVPTLPLFLSFSLSSLTLTFSFLPFLLLFQSFRSLSSHFYPLSPLPSHFLPFSPPALRLSFLFSVSSPSHSLSSFIPSSPLSFFSLLSP